MAVPWRTKENLLRDITMVSLGLEYSTRLVLGIHAQMLKWQIDSTSLLNALNPGRRKWPPHLITRLLERVAVCSRTKYSYASRGMLRCWRLDDSKCDAEFTSL